MLEIVEAGHPALRTPTRAVPMPTDDPFGLASLVNSMIETMRAAPGVGLAANQVARDMRLIVLEDRPEHLDDLPEEVLAQRERESVDLQVLVNPTLHIVDDDVVEWFEGCLSIPDYTAIVPRWRKVRVAATDLEGGAVEFEAVGWHARILQHEVDHLDGRLYVDRMLPRSFMTTDAYLDTWSSEPISECRRRLGIAERMDG